jgi:hypothetical protein
MEKLLASGYSQEEIDGIVLTKEEAEEYRLFCKRSTIVFKGCYGDGSKMWPKWNAFKAEIASL